MQRLLAIVATLGTAGVALAQDPCGQTELFGPESPEFGTPGFELNRLDLSLDFLDDTGAPSCPAAPSFVVAEITPIDGQPDPFTPGTCLGGVRLLVVSPSSALSPLPLVGGTGQVLQEGLLASSVQTIPFACEVTLPPLLAVPIPDSPVLAGATFYFQAAESRLTLTTSVANSPIELLLTEVIEVKLSI